MGVTERVPNPPCPLCGGVSVDVLSSDMLKGWKVYCPDCRRPAFLSDQACQGATMEDLWRDIARQFKLYDMRRQGLLP